MDITFLYVAGVGKPPVNCKKLLNHVLCSLANKYIFSYIFSQSLQLHRVAIKTTHTIPHILYVLFFLILVSVIKLLS